MVTIVSENIQTVPQAFSITDLKEDPERLMLQVLDMHNQAGKQKAPFP